MCTFSFHFAGREIPISNTIYIEFNEKSEKLCKILHFTILNVTVNCVMWPIIIQYAGLYYICYFSAIFICFLIKVFGVLVSLAKDLKNCLVSIDQKESQRDTLKKIIEFTQFYSDTLQLSEEFSLLTIV